MTIGERIRHAVVPGSSASGGPHLAPRNRAPQLPAARWAEALALLAIVAAGFLLRLHLVLRGDFPLNDGGLFYVMIKQLQAHGYRLPDYVIYNGLQIPFMYPPIALYTAGLLTDATHMSVLSVFRFLPTFVSTFTILAFFLLAQAFLHSRIAASISSLLFALLPTSYTWFIGGGGLTRSFGYLFALLALWQLYRVFERPARGRIFLGAFLVALTVLSHPSETLFLAASAASLTLALARTWRTIAAAFAVAAMAVVLSAPWWALIISRHGLAPMLAASQSRGGTVVAILALPAVLACRFRPRLFALWWALSVAAVDPLEADRHLAVVLALAAGIGVASAVRSLWGSADTAANGARFSQLFPEGHWSRPAGIGAAVFLSFAIGTAIAAPSSHAQTLGRADRMAMTWVAQQTPRGSTFVIITGRGGSLIRVGRGSTLQIDEGCLDNRISEWFPVLAERLSLLTAPGREWINDFGAAVARCEAAEECAAQGTACLSDWSRKTGQGFDYVYLPKGPGRSDGPSSRQANCCPVLSSALLKDPAYRLVYDGPGAAVFVRSDDGSSIALPGVVSTPWPFSAGFASGETPGSQPPAQSR